MTYKNKVILIRQILNEIIRVVNKDNESREIVWELELAKIREIPSDAILSAFSDAIGNVKKRVRAFVYIYSRLTDIEGIEGVLKKLLQNPDPDIRSIVIQSVRSFKTANLISLLNNHFYNETNDICIDDLLFTLGFIGAENSFPIFKKISENEDNKFQSRVLWSFIKYQKDETKPYFIKVFNNDEDNKYSKVLAAWGLAKLGDKEYLNYLIEMLDDKVIKTPNLYDPGVSLRAAQAISDILGWDFEWNTNSVRKVKERINVN